MWLDVEGGLDFVEVKERVRWDYNKAHIEHDRNFDEFLTNCLSVWRGDNGLGYKYKVYRQCYKCVLSIKKNCKIMGSWMWKVGSVANNYMCR